MGFDISREHTVKFCTTLENTVGLYKLLGFTPLADAPIDSADYRLRGAWLPMKLDHRDVFKAFLAVEMPAAYREFSPELYNAVTTRALHADDIPNIGGEYLRLLQPLWKRKNQHS